MPMGKTGELTLRDIEKINQSLTLGPEYLIGERLAAIELSDSGDQELRLEDDEKLKFGTGTGSGNTVDFDVQMAFDGTQLEMLPRTDDLCAFNIGDGTTDMDFKVFMGATTSHVLFDNSAALVTFTKTRMIMGAQGTGVSTSSAALNAFEVHALTASAITADGTGLSCGVRCRYEIGAAQTNQVSLIAVEGRLRIKAAVADGAHAGVNGGIEADGAITFTGTGTTQMSGAHFYLELGSTCVFTGASGYVTGVTIDSSSHATQTDIANVTLAGLRIKKSSGKLAWVHGIYLDDAAATTGITIGTCTDGITITGATGYALDVQTSGQVRLGVQGTGIPTATATPFALEVHAETNGSAVLTAGNSGLSCGIRCRYEISKAQTNNISLVGVEGRLRVKAGIADGNHAGVMGTIEADASIAFTGTSTTSRSAGAFAIELGASCTLSAGFLCGITVDSSVNSNVDMSNVEFCGIRVKTSSSKEVWEHGLYLDASACATGITIGACSGNGISISGTFTGASSRSIKTDMTIANPTYGDGYSANEFQLNITGTAAGHISCGGMWVNINSGTHNDSNFICAQTNGVYQAAGTITGKVVIFGMRMAHQCTNNGSTYFYPWSIVSASGLNVTTALIHCSAAAINLGAISDGGSDDGVLVPLYQEGPGGNIGYVRIYSHS